MAAIDTARGDLVPSLVSIAMHLRAIVGIVYRPADSATDLCNLALIRKIPRVVGHRRREDFPFDANVYIPLPREDVLYADVGGRKLIGA
jgi:hypothetical protein